MFFNIPLEQAQELLLSCVRPPVVEEVALLEALGRVLARDVYSVEDIPPFDRSPLDGYAVRAKDTEEASATVPARLKVIAELPAGLVWPVPLSQGTAIKIMTGAPIPPGANAIIKIEDVQPLDNEILIRTPLKPDSNIVKAGEDVKAGELVLKRGSFLNAGAIGMLAAVNRETLPVFEKPKIAVICTGEELVELGAVRGPGKIRNSNLYAISAAVIEAGGQPILMGTVPDRLEEISRAMEQGLEQADLIVTTGGASVGEYDLVGEAYSKINSEILFRRVAVKPGTPTLAAKRSSQLLVGLSGNPAAALIGFEFLVRPLIKVMSGWSSCFRPRVEAVMAEDFNKAGGPRRFLRAMVKKQEGSYRVFLAGKQSPGILKSILHCNALVDVPEGSGPLKAGEKVEAIILAESEVLTL
ncbi:MAG: gephyrin-like molybdotransferase Glp [Bacillota bacterium]